MQFDKDRPRPPVARREPVYRPAVENLESRLLLAGAPVLDLGGQTSPNLYPASAVTQTVNGNINAGPYGIDLGGGQAGGQSNGAAGWSVTDVGDMNGDGYDDYVIGAPTAINSTGLSLGNTFNSRAYLVYGSNAVNQTTIQNWLDLTAEEATNGVPNGTYHVGDLQQLGAASQTNPISGLAGLAFNGITFTTSGASGTANLATQLGASVAPVPGGVTLTNGTNEPAFLIGAPGADGLGDSTGTSFPNYGRVYLVVGGSYLAALPASTTVNLDAPATSPVTFATFGAAVGTGPIQLGASEASLSNFFADGAGQQSIAVGAPMATYNGNTDAGVVFVIPQSAYTAAIGTTNTINLASVGQTNGLRGVVFGGNATNDFAGFSVANAGDVDGALSGANAPLPDLLIGAPGTNDAFNVPTAAGTAYLIYGRQSLLSAGTKTNTGLNNVNLISIPLNTVGNTTVTPTDILGAVFTGLAGDAMGYAVAGAGDVNNDGFADFLLGAPLENGTGSAFLVMGQAASTTVIKGDISLEPTLPINIQIANFTGTTGSLAGYSLSMLGKINGDNFPEFLVGAPGYASDQGAAFLVAGRSTLVGTIPLDSRDSIVMTINSGTTFGTAPTFFGASVGGRPFTLPQPNTADGDTIPDPIVGTPGYSVSTGRNLDGGAFIEQGAYLQPLVPTQLATTTQLNTPGSGATTAVDANGPLVFYVLGQLNVGGALGNNFDPATGIDTTTLVLSSSLTNFVPVSLSGLPGVTITVTPITDPNNVNITDAKITVTFAAGATNPLNLFNGAQTLTLSGLLMKNALTNPVTLTTGGFTGGLTALVSNGASGGVTPTTPTTIGSSVPIGVVNFTYFQTSLGPDQFVPTPTTLSAYNYKPIPKRVAYMQFQPNLAFKMRILNYEDPSKYHFQAARTASPNKHGSSLVLSQYTFDHSVFHPGKTVVVKHKTPVIPTQEQRQKLTPRK